MPYKDPEVRKRKSAERFKSWAAKNPGKANQRMREWRERNPKYMLFKSAERRAKIKGIPFEITMEDIPDIPEICPLALIPIFRRGDGKRGPCDNSPSLDRREPEKGYIKGNIYVISHRANRWKGEMTHEQILRLAAYTAPGLEGQTVEDYARFFTGR